MSRFQNIVPPDAACVEMQEACDELFFGVEGFSYFSAVLIVGCYGAEEPQSGVQHPVSTACLRTRIDRPSSAAKLLERLREVVSDLETQVAAEASRVQH